jgi:membrane-bound serine protease (ClpP class)
LNPRTFKSALACTLFLLAGAFCAPRLSAQTRPLVVEVRLGQMIHHVSAEYVVRGIHHASQINADAVLLELDTPGGLQNSMREIVQAILDSRVPVITYVAPSGGSAASAGFFVLLAGDVAVMAPGTNAGAAHPVIIGVSEIGKTMEAKLENDAAAYIRSIATSRGRNAALAEDAVRKSASYTDKEALDGKLIEAIASTPNEIFAKFDGKTIKRADNSRTTLHLANAQVEPFTMPWLEMFFSWVADPNIAFILGAIGLACLYIEFTHPGLVVPGVVGAIALILALYAFNLLPINYTGVILILMALVLFALEVKLTSHGVLAAGGIIALVLGALILVKSPWPEARIHLSTALGVALPLGAISVILVRLAIIAKQRKAVTGEAGMIGLIGVAETDFDRKGKVLIHGELWNVRAPGKVPKGTPLRVKAVEGLTLVVEPEAEPRQD